MRYAQIRNMDVSNGIGIGAALFVQGCPFHCNGCFNQETWDYNGGKEFTEEIENKFLDICKNPYITRISILGGEPLCKENHMTIRRIINELLPLHKKIWIYTGYTYESLTREQFNTILGIDYLVDGQFIIEKKDLALKFRGSSNQRIIDVKQTMNSGVITCLNL